MKCTACGGSGTMDSSSMKNLNAEVKAATSSGSKLKSLGRKRPDDVKSGMSRGGKYARN